MGQSDCLKVEKIRRLILLLRLEVAQANMMNMLQNNAVDRAQLRRNKQIVDDFDAALAIFDPQGALHSSLLKSDLNGFAATCARNLQIQDRMVSRLFGVIAFAEMSAKSNVLDIAGRNSSLVGVEPTLIDTLDGYARDLAEFDVDCAAQ